MNKKGKSKVTSTTCEDKEERSIRSRRDDATWDMSTVASLVELMYMQFQQGQLLTSTFSDQIWKGIASELFHRHNVQYSVTQLKGKACRLRILWRKFHDLITKKTGFGWDPLSGTVTASDEYWTSWIAENPEEASLRKKGLPHYDLCTEMFSKSVATGAFARSSAVDPLDSDEDEDLNGGLRTTYKGTSQTEGISLGVRTPSMDHFNAQQTSARRPSDKQSLKRKRVERLDAAVDAWASVNNMTAAKMSKSANDAVEDCMAALDSMEGLSEKKFFLAQDAFLNRTRRKMFLLMSDEKRRRWVESLSEP